MLRTDVHIYHSEMYNSHCFPPRGPSGICWGSVALQALEDTDTGYTCGRACKVVEPPPAN